DNVPPHIILNPLVIDYAAKKATLTYTIPEISSVEVSLLDAEGKLLEILDAGTKTAGTYNLEYANKNDASKQFKVVAIDKAKNESEKTTGIFSVIPENVLKISNLSANPEKFSPNSKVNSQARIGYQISGGVSPYKVNVSILAPSGATVIKLVEDESQNAGAYSYYWNGSRITQSEPCLPAGRLRITDSVYVIKMNIEDKIGAKVESESLVTVVATKPTLEATLDNDKMSPNGDGIKDELKINYKIDYPVAYITEPAEVKIEILNSKLEVIFTKILSHTPGSYSYSWDGVPSDGAYFARITGKDALGVEAEVKTLNFICDTAAPVIEIKEVAPNPFSPNPNGIKDETSISYTISEDTLASVAIKNKKGNIIRNLQTGKTISASSIKNKISIKSLPYVVWEGKDNDGNIAVDGDYSFVVTAADFAGNISENTSPITVDNNANYTNALPPIVNIDIEPKYANLNRKVTVDFSVPEVLLSDPVVYFGNYPGVKESMNKITDSRYDYQYSRIISDEPEGNTKVSIQTTDLAGNISSTESYFTVDKTNPDISNISYSANPAKAGELTIKFQTKEPLNAMPTIEVTQNNGKSQTIITNSEWDKIDGAVEAKYDVYSSIGGINDGTAEV
ncbi:MAG: FG-GAP repeat protein, partial [Candidatus Saganbacteria bacterium]